MQTLNCALWLPQLVTHGFPMALKLPQGAMTTAEELVYVVPTVRFRSIEPWEAGHQHE